MQRIAQTFAAQLLWLRLRLPGTNILPVVEQQSHCLHDHITAHALSAARF